MLVAKHWHNPASLDDSSSSKVAIMPSWHPASWLDFPTTQQPKYPFPDDLAQVTATLSELPQLVTHIEIESLKHQLASVANGEAFLLQGGDCAELFSECTSTIIKNKLKILLQMSLILLHGLHKPVIRVGRMAGQYAKPRSAVLEQQNGISLPSYRGDLVNRPEFDELARVPDANNLLKGYQYSALTLNYIRALVDNGFADLQHPENWDLKFVNQSPHAKTYQAIVESSAAAIDFMNSVNAVRTRNIERVAFYTSHEALLLPYEQALTRQADDGRWYAMSTHFPWIGMRTAAPDGGHVEFLRGISNPIAVKIGPNTSQDMLKALIHRLNPDNEPGRLTLITRFGANAIARELPKLIDTVLTERAAIVWSCDPMHGNTHITNHGIKTRHFDDILSELTSAFEIHQACGSHLGGVHFEMTSDDVTECIGGTQGVSETDLTKAYKSVVDPRLNYEQALEIAMLIVAHSKKQKSEF